MIRHLYLIVPCVIATGLLAADLPEKWSKRLESTEANYHAAVQKADNVRFYAIQKASQERVKALKSALTDATKSGDFDAATELKSRLAAAETAGGVRPKPKNTVKFGGHEYALIEDKATWHVAKRLCEEMGGHLAIVETEAEEKFLEQLCGKNGAWMGASDNATEGDWRWVTGSAVAPAIVARWILNNENNIEHALVYWPAASHWEDGVDSNRYCFVCEWGD